VVTVSLDLHKTVEPDGPIPAEFFVVGEAPAREELKQGRGFVGPSGRLLWPLMRRLASLDRMQCRVSNLCHHALDNDVSGDAKLSPEEFEACSVALYEELIEVKPRRILAVGALVSRALLGDRFLSMEACNGVGFEIGDFGNGRCFVVPTWHPAAALRPGGEDKLAHTGAAVAALRDPPIHPMYPPAVPDISGDLPFDGLIGIDTEGTPADPICATVATVDRRCYLDRDEVLAWWNAIQGRDVTLVYHNAPWDWTCLQAMGIHAPWTVPYVDTMERAYLKQLPTQGLKPLAWRYLGLRMRSWEDVVMPHYNEYVRSEADSIIFLGTTTQERSPKTGRLYKKPKHTYTDEAKALRRLRDPKKLAERMSLPPPSLRFVPEDEAREYSTLDPWATVKLWPCI